jgi:hypothetical protein
MHEGDVQTQNHLKAMLKKMKSHVGDLRNVAKHNLPLLSACTPEGHTLKGEGDIFFSMTTAQILVPYRQFKECHFYSNRNPDTTSVHQKEML